MRVATVCRKLAVHGLVLFSQGNASARGFAGFYIKASGVECAKATARDTVEVGLPEGSFSADGPKPSTDAAAHAVIYNKLPEIGGIVHTHSTWATTWAVAGLAIPCCSTGQSDVFGGDIPCGAYCPIGGEDIGVEVVRLYEFDRRRRAFLIRQHGLFAIGATVEEAMKAAVLAEHCAQVTYQAERLHGLKRVPQAEIDANYERYHTAYGQP